MASGKDEYVPAAQGRGFTMGKPVKPKKNENNAEFMDRLMNFSSSGPIMQVFILDSLGKMANRLADMPFEEVERILGKDCLISPLAWHQCAKELQREFKGRGL